MKLNYIYTFNWKSGLFFNSPYFSLNICWVKVREYSTYHGISLRIFNLQKSWLKLNK